MLRLQVGLDKKETQTTTLTRENLDFGQARERFSVLLLQQLEPRPR